MTGEGAPDEQAFDSRADIHCVPAQQVRHTIGLKTVSAIQHSDGAAQGKLGGEHGGLRTGGAGGVNNSQCTGLQGRKDIHATRISQTWE
ncbi:MAG: hypothetical protein Q7U34_00970 [Anaerolineales bacterium]|nr:hypothetical protein [Anaerolineales bacterium]